MRKTNIYFIKSVFFLFICVFLPGIPMGGVLADEVMVVEAKVEEVPVEVELNTIQEMVFYKDSLYILDSGNHRILRIENNHVTRQIGIIGNGKGEFYYPSDLYIGKNGYFYVLDRGNRRIQLLNSKGEYIGHFREQPRAFGMAVNSKGNLLLGQAKSNHLISVYDLKGNRILDFGELIMPSGIYGGKYKKYDKSHRFPMNRLYLAVGEDDELWVGFYHMPVICKFNRNGCLVKKKIIELPGLEPLKQAVWDPSSLGEYITFGLDGLVLTMFVNDLVYEENSRRLYVLLGDNRILVLNSDAGREYVIKPRIIKGVIENIAVNNKGEIFASFFFSTKLYRLVLQNFFCPKRLTKYPLKWHNSKVNDVKKVGGKTNGCYL